MTALPHAFYPESSWRDDLELGAAELALAGQALGDPRAADWLAQARRWASGTSRTRPATTRSTSTTSARSRTPTCSSVARQPVRRARRDAGSCSPTCRRQLAAVPARPRTTRSAPARTTTTSTPRRTLRARRHRALYRRLTGDAPLRRLRDRAARLGLRREPVGHSLMIGVGTSFPQCPQHVVANLRRHGRAPPVLPGAVVNGPNGADLFNDGLGEFFDEGRTCPPDGDDRYAAVHRARRRYVDDVRSWQTVEPAIDFTAPPRSR